MSWARYAHPLILSLAVFLVYGQTARFALLSWDDAVNITQNPYLNPVTWDSLFHLWTHSYAKLYVPVFYTSLAINLMMPGDVAALLHGTNVLLHLATVLAAYGLLQALLSRSTGILPIPTLRTGALAGALLFALHPLQVEPVAWITGRKDLLAGLFALLATRQYLRWRDAARPLVYASALVFYLLSLASKPAAVALPVALVTLDLFVLRSPYRRCLSAVAPFFLAAALWTLMTQAAQPITGSSSPGERLSLVVATTAFYLWKLAVPVRLAAVYQSQELPALLLKASLAVALFSGILLLLGRKLKREVFAAMIWWGAMLLPVLGFVSFHYQQFSPVADRYAYTAVFAPAWLLSLTYCRLLLKLPRQERLLAGGLAAFALALGFLSSRQSAHWRNSEALWRRAVEISPANAFARLNYGNALSSANRPQDAIPHLEEAVRLRPNSLEAQRSLGLLQRQAGDLQRARLSLQSALKLAPEDTEANTQMGLLHLQEGDMRQAEQRLEVALKGGAAPSYAWAGLGMVKARSGETTAAAALLQRALELRPEDLENRVAYATVLHELGRHGEAEQAYREVLRMRPGHAAASQGLVRLLLAVGRPREAESYLRETLKKTRTAELHVALAALLQASHRDQEAAQELRNALRIRPSDLNILNNLAWLLATSRDPEARDGTEAVALARKAVELRPQDGNLADTLAAAFAEAGEPAKAAEAARKAAQLFRQAGQPQLATRSEGRVASYASGERHRSK